MKTYSTYLFFPLLFLFSYCHSQEVLKLSPFKKDTLFTIRIDSKIIVQSTVEARETFQSQEKKSIEYRAAKFILVDYLKEAREHLYEMTDNLEEREMQNYTVFTDLNLALKKPLNVYALDLSGQKLGAIPKEVLEFKNLQELYFSDNQLDSFPSCLIQLEFLKILALSENNISSIPMEISKLKYLEELYLHKNKITSLSLQILASYNLYIVDVSFNQLTEITSENFKLKTFRLLDIEGNPNIDDLLKQIKKDSKLLITRYEDDDFRYNLVKKNKGRIFEKKEYKVEYGCGTIMPYYKN